MVEDMGDFGSSGVPPVPPPGEAGPSGPSGSSARSKARGVAAGVGVALVVGAGGIAVASSGGTTTGAAGATPTATEGAPTPPPGVPRGPGHFGKFTVGPGMAGLGIGGDVLHGTYVVAKAGGGYETLQMQNGTVSAVSSTSLSVKSADGYSFTYVVKAGTIVDAQSAGIGSVKKGDTVAVTATVSGSTATVDRVMDVTLLKKSLPDLKRGYGFPGVGPGGLGGKMRHPEMPPNPTATPGATT